LHTFTLASEQQRATKVLKDTENSEDMFTSHQIYFNSGHFIRDLRLSITNNNEYSKCISAWIPFLFRLPLDLGEKYLLPNGIAGKLFPGDT
jgi:hypothetical protein